MKQLRFHFDHDRVMPVELLRDARGVYGIGANGGAARHRFERLPDALILRPDRFEEAEPCRAVLQRITGGFRYGMFSHMAEEHLRQFIHHAALRRAGLPWPPRPAAGEPAGWWSKDKKQQARNRAVYHGLRLQSLGVINRLIGQALEQAADADAIKTARQFAFGHRERIYRASARSRRALQLASTFPVLALAIYSDHWRLKPIDFGDFNSWDATKAKCEAHKKAAADLVERGARLRDAAAVLDIPMALRRVKPGAAHLVSNIFCDHPELLDFMPESLPRSRDWLQLVRLADRRAGADFGRWAARRVPQIPGRLEQAGFFLSDLADWARAGLGPSEDFPEPPVGREFVTRPFTPSMALKTVTRLSAAWHEAVAADMSGPQFAFPAPWYPAATLGNYEILPIDSSAGLYREGAAMHHCAGTYADAVRLGAIYIYSIRRNGERVATLELRRTGNRPAITQLRGPCNAQVPKEITATAQRWLRTQPPPPPKTETCVFVDYGGDIPF